MENKLQVFNNSDFGQVRTTIIDSDIWFVAKDVCDSLEIQNASDAIKRLDDDEKGVASIYTLGGNQQLQTINEAGLYSLVLGSRKPEAKTFKRWITHEVIPTIRKTGGYVSNDDMFLNTYLPNADEATKQFFKLNLEAMKSLNNKIEQDKPKVLFADAVATSKTCILVGELAKILKQNGINIGQNRLFEQLRNDGYLISRKCSDFNMPTQRSMELGLFKIKENSIVHSDGHTSVNKTPKLTGKGQAYFVNRYLGGN